MGMKMYSCVEYFSIMVTARNIPYAYWDIGATDPDVWDNAVGKAKIENFVPDNRSPFFAPALHTTLRTGTNAMALAAFTFLMAKS